MVQLLLDWVPYTYTQGVIDDAFIYSCTELEHSTDKARRIVELFLLHGANIHKDNDYALIVGCNEGDIEFFNLLLRWGANIHTRNDGGFLIAIVRHHIHIARLFLEWGGLGGPVDIHMREDEALMLAVKKSTYAMVKFLLEKGANIHARNDEALMFAVANNKINIVSLLLKFVWGAGSTRSLRRTADIHAADIHAREDEALMLAVKSGNFDMIRFLLYNGANIHARNDEAIVLASSYGDINTVRFLLEKGADIYAQELARNHALQRGRTNIVHLIDEWKLRRRVN